MINNYGFMGFVIEYVIVFVLVLLVNYFLFVRKNKTYDINKIPVELKYVITLYKINIKNINYKKFVWIYSLINTFIVSTVYMIIMYLVKELVFQIIFGIVLLVLLIIICYGILGKIYEKKGDKKCTTLKK